MPYIVKKSLVEIDELGQFYVVGVKKGAIRLFKEFQELQNNQILSKIQTTERQKGAQIQREVALYPCTQWVSQNWQSSKRMIVVTNTKIEADGSRKVEQHFYLSNYHHDNVEFFAKTIRNHWGIENNLHWVKDVHFKEDNSLIRNRNSAFIYSILFSLVLNIVRLYGYKSWKPWLAHFANRIDRIVAVI
ncbi:ISAs1 family transposase [Kingella kingae]|uniref:ISAs1 family transposase n=2 Tax=Kingella kingae TaxID=504 RepID=UPI00254CDA12|nr:ISAs1 family transposase [Kingella kingae]MDK4535109.1 ISAs1 family transposase [Kingella kingae]MDK4554383.1 ISAs1 family transposase [Kingella kingae]